MAILGHGIDLVHCARIERIWKEHGDAFIDRVYTPRERRYCLDARHAVVRLSGRFAAKEAVFKMLGTGWRGGMRWTDVETLPDELGRPVVLLHGETLALARAIGIRRIELSISHAGDYAMASAIGSDEAGAIESSLPRPQPPA